ncbi:hypothetical protein PISMIDRAFT_687817 [Pisolithus microcarpus 441]|uniref:Uncharacterized protein n=1 Tax=Pisolithus microcarpus 441 TaxID=765257 RepID=A0A0C9YLB6_9AGAM|nr:hypothetical protein PISMIDRAFT_687817 [Pisolithus microcarpus 441]
MNKYHKCRACALPCINNDCTKCNSFAHATQFPDKLACRAPAEFGITALSTSHTAFAPHPRKTRDQQPASVFSFLSS